MMVLGGVGSPTSTNHLRATWDETSNVGGDEKKFTSNFDGDIKQSTSKVADDAK